MEFLIDDIWCRVIIHFSLQLGELTELLECTTMHLQIKEQSEFSTW